MYFYRDILSRAWDLTKKHKFLWFFGLFAALIAGNGGEIEIYFKSLGSLTEKTSLFSPNFWISGTSSKVLEHLNNLVQLQGVSDYILLFSTLVVTLVVVWFVIISQTALIYATGQYLLKKTTNFKQAIKNSQKYFWSILFLNILGKIFVYGLLLVLAVPWLAGYMQTGVTTFQVMYLVVSFFILVPLAIIISFLIKYSAGYIILKKQHVFKAIGHAWGLFLRNWLISLEMALVIFGLNLLVSFSVFAAVLILTSPFLILTSLTGIVSKSFSELTFFIALAFLLLFLAVILVGAIFSVFQWSAWMLLFAELTKGKARPKVIRWFKD